MSEADPGQPIAAPETDATPEIVVSGIYTHYEGTSYRVDEIVTRAEGYELTGQLAQDVLYTQMTDGEVNPAGTRYTRSKEEFLHGTALVDGQRVPIFQLNEPESEIQ